MSIANPRLHIICGICGCNNELIYEIVGREVPGKHLNVHIRCRNCDSLTELREVMEAKIQYSKKENVK
ncbi:MAG: hypothetical protein DRP01_00065 [Archaeoglobales archaeon]|nr:MAG: hypothetical protein DRP01_00065 [Archaeoglobales archaeon]